MNIDFLSPWQWHIMLTGTTWILVHPWDMLFALPQTTRLLNSWKNSFSMNTSQHSEHFFWITPWTETFWAQCSAVLSPPGHLFSVHPWEMLYHRPQSSSIPINDFAMNVSQCPGYQTMNRDFLSPLQWNIMPIVSTLTCFHLYRMLYHGPQGSLTHGKPLNGIAMNIFQHSGHLFSIKSCHTHILSPLQCWQKNSWTPFHRLDVLLHIPRLFHTW